MAKKNSDRIRLPELPIFKKYSLAVRQEFASPKELLAALDRTARKVETFLDKAETDEVSSPELTTEESSRDLDSLGEFEPSEVEATGEFQIEVPETSHESAPAPEQEQSEFRLFEELSEDGDTEAEFDDRPLWEPEPPVRAAPIKKNVKKAPSPVTKKASVTRSGASSRSLAGKRNPAKARSNKSNKKRRTPRPEIVRVSSRGTPLKSQPAKRATGRKRGR